MYRADIRKHPVYVRAVVEGATHAAAAAAAAAATPETAASIAMGMDITKGLEMQEMHDHTVQGEVNPPDAKGKTIAVNLALYSLSPYNCWYIQKHFSYIFACMHACVHACIHADTARCRHRQQTDSAKEERRSDRVYIHIYIHIYICLYLLYY